MFDVKTFLTPSSSCYALSSKAQSLEQPIDCASKASTGDLKRLAEDLKLWFRNWTAEGFFRAIQAPESALKTLQTTHLAAPKLV